jgi:hypothetical protein
LLTHSRDPMQRRRGQTDAGSWAAHIVARICETMIVVLVVSCWLAAAGASAAARGHSADPAPQKAPTSAASSQPTPDPAPQAATTSPAPHQSIVTRPAIREPVVSTPTRTVVVTPARTVSTTAAKTVASSPSPAQPVRHVSPPPARAPHVAAPHHARSQATRLSFPLALPRDLLLLPGAAVREGTTGHRDGVLLLLTSLAMAVLAVASFALLRRLRRLELR